ncbi:Protein FAM234B [Larimichthys crocea]|uniref:Uncharacterized protein n=1 Tax=Larimichthys crocea TaxID=215358 RepID=A0ACD3R750_LARCR|nr:Protein FAM234B [Larimichthys crocea]
MAAALSRALKLPGKKGSDLGEYDPLTQADSEDESEEDDLVLNYPRNGLGRDCLGTGSSKLRGGRSGRLGGSRRRGAGGRGGRGGRVEGTTPQQIQAGQRRHEGHAVLEPQGLWKGQIRGGQRGVWITGGFWAGGSQR